ncbi:helix-turn-helix transcriptional regulator [Chryseobacterium indologenes]|uniref:helix-turn-helix domain-containing protein n=1 Tax=Chryseobacterium indologenes TaxID=253 RepID=UPI002577C96B|nr:AraC family transcriptional regulator [Chryseobacterium indologenes]MDM1555886.1 helix-turn-helix transcriptional regulator [Chryseobacterium indologenes]
MALFITLDNVYQLYDIDPSKKTDGIVIYHQMSNSNNEYTEHSRLFDGLLLGFMINGSMKMQIHFLDYEINAGDIAVLPPQLLMDTKYLSDDAEIVTIGISLDFMSAFPMLREFVMDNQIRWKPVIRLREDEISLQNELITLIKNFYHKNPSPNKAEILRHLVMVMINMISEVYTEMPNSKGSSNSRTHAIIDDFYQLILKYTKEQRSVNFYAEKLHLTPQYLSTFLKKRTGRSVSQWIDHILILEAKTLLKSTNLSIKEISNELNFGETSIFCRYFKRITGVSPKSYRNLKTITRLP